MSTPAATMGITTTPLTARPTARRRTAWVRACRLALGVVVIAVLTVELVLAAPSVVSAGTALAGSSAGWLAAAAAVASMIAFAAVRSRTLRAGGVTMPLRRSVPVSYAAGALHTSLPGGAVISTAYAFRQLRSWGASNVVATWSLAVTGLLAASVTLSIVGLAGVLLGGGATGSVLQSAGAIAVALLVITAMVRLTRRPDRLSLAAGRVLAGNRLRGRPAEIG
ncbi:MAG TPA: hypothetical protein VFC16_07240 [Nakamurella sp.]|nr:hypothetical protein [Nakamurella sp.]